MADAQKLGTARHQGRDVEYGVCGNSARKGWGWVKAKDGRIIILTYVPTRQQVEDRGDDPNNWKDKVDIHNNLWNV